MLTTKKLLVSTGLLLSLGLAGCGDNEEVSQPVSQENAESEFGFVSFDLDIDTADTRDAVEVSFDVENNQTEAEYVNRLENKELFGDEAYDYLKQVFQNLDIQKGMEQQEVISSVLKEFNVSDYTEFELDIEFDDRTEVEYRDKK